MPQTGEDWKYSGIFHVKLGYGFSLSWIKPSMFEECIT